MAGYGLLVRFELKPGHENDFDDLVRRTVDAIRDQEPGTVVYATHTVDAEPTVRVFYELYRDRAAFEDHEGQPHVRAFLESRDEHVSSVSVDVLTAAVSKITAWVSAQ